MIELESFFSSLRKKISFDFRHENGQVDFRFVTQSLSIPATADESQEVSSLGLRQLVGCSNGPGSFKWIEKNFQPLKQPRFDQTQVLPSNIVFASNGAVLLEQPQVRLLSSHCVS